MKMNNENQFDQFFADQFNNFEQKPNADLWEKMNEEMELEKIDHLVQRELANCEITPDEKIWMKVEPKLPLSLLVRNHLNALSKIAAILVVGMLVTMYFHGNKVQSNNTIVENSSDTSTDVENINELETLPEYVFEIQEEVEEEVIASNVLSEKQENLIEADDFLASLLDDEDEFLLQLNDDDIQEVLKPIEQLPIENISAMLGKEESAETLEEEVIDLQIKIPLIVVEAGEVEELIEMYDQNASKSNQ